MQLYLSPKGYSMISKRKRKKGQVIAVEQSILFAIGFTFLLFVFLIISTFYSSFQSSASKSGSNLILNYVASALMIPYSINATKSVMIIKIPKLIAGKPYIIKGNGNLLILDLGTANYIKRMPIYVEGSVSSLSGKIVIVKYASRREVFIQS